MTKAQLENLNATKLKEIAKNLGIAGYAGMNKAKLVSAILDAGNGVKGDGEPKPFNKVPGKYLKFNEILKGEN